jgi:hypothetical protein
MQRIRRILPLVALVAASAVGIGVDPVSADDADPAAPAAPAGETAGSEVGSLQVVPLAPGVDLLLPQHDGHVVGEGRGACPGYHLCLWEHAHYRGPGLGLYSCRNHNLADYGFQDRASSLVNNQTPGTMSYFYDGAAANISLRQHAYGYRDNLMLDYAAVPGPHGNNWNDRIDRVRVC